MIWVLGFMLLALAAVGQSTLSSGSTQNLPTSAEQVIGRNQDPYAGSLPQGKPTGQVLELTLHDAIQRGLAYNLGLYLSRQSEIQAHGLRRESLAGILPNLNGNINVQAQKLNLEALGIGGKTVFDGVTFQRSIGPFSTNQAVGAISWNILDLHAINNLRAANENVHASYLSYRDARETVVTAVCANYLLAIADDSQVSAAQAQLDTAKSLWQLAQDQEKAGLSPFIDTLRANVEVQARQQELTEAENQLAKQYIALARAIGLPVRQKIHVAEAIPYQRLSAVEMESALRRALQNRPDYLSALAQLRSAERQRAAAWDQYLPSFGFTGNYGVIGYNPLSTSPQWTATGAIQIPIFQGGRIEGEVKQADALVAQRRATVENLRGQIEQDVENALLDLQSAAKQVDTAVAQLQLATETLAQARDRFRAGVTNNIEVIQAQDSLVAANDSYIASVYAYNIAKVSLARAVGSAEQSAMQYLQTP
jgi:outer membrane protein TolC